MKRILVLWSLLQVLIIAFFAGETTCESVQDYICSQKFRGWTLDYASRTCHEDTATGCIDPFPYKSKHECLQDFQGHGNICDKSPCLHRGACLPVTTEKGRTYKCDCSETGYYGSRCHRKCPSFLSKRHFKQTACIQIG